MRSVLISGKGLIEFYHTAPSSSLSVFCNKNCFGSLSFMQQWKKQHPAINILIQSLMTRANYYWSSSKISLTLEISMKHKRWNFCVRANKDSPFTPWLPARINVELRNFIWVTNSPESNILRGLSLQSFHILRSVRTIFMRNFVKVFEYTVRSITRIIMIKRNVIE